METGRFKEIIRYSNRNRKQMNQKVREFYSTIGMDSEKVLLNLMQIARPLFQKKGFIIVELPFADREIGALCYRGDSLGYTLLNTSLPKVNVNFALCHEIYHIFCQETELKTKVELYINEHYYEHEEEFAANLFAGMLLMPEQIYSFMYHKFEAEQKKGDSRLSILVKLMNYFEVPYMAALIRCYELKLLEDGAVLEELIHTESSEIREEFGRLWLDESILDATGKDDYLRFELLVKHFGALYQQQEYVNSRTVNIALKNMRALYNKIRGD